MDADRVRLEELAVRAETAPPLDALRAVRAMREELAELEEEHVGRAVEDGSSWRDVAEALGVTRQAAHKRHARRPPRERRRAAAAPGRVLVTSEARQAVRFGREEAGRCGAQQVGTEHLLLGILRCDYCIAIQALARVGVTLDAARAALAPTIAGAAPSAGAAPPAGAEVISDAARGALEQSLREAVARGEGYLGVEHLLMALLRDEQSGAVRTLAELGADAGAVRGELERTVEASLQAQPRSAAPYFTL
jgi:ATP-dependent Clp protease ATP-binding subunit ClpA